MGNVDRRKFLQGSGLVLGGIALESQINALDGHRNSGNATANVSSEGSSSSQALPSLCNTNIKTNIGLGDETPGIIDQFGQLDSQNASICLSIGDVPLKSPDLHWSQSLEGGYLPIVNTEVRSAQGSARWTSAATTEGTVQADYLEFNRADLQLKLDLWFPFTTRIEANDGIVTSGDRILAVLPPSAAVNLSQAKFNLATPARESWSLSRQPWSPEVAAGFRLAPIPGLDPAFASGRSSYLFRSLRYRFPVDPGNTYHVILGLYVQKRGEFRYSRSESLLDLSANDKTVIVDMADLAAGEPFLHDFVVQPSTDEIRVASAVNPSSTSPYRWVMLNAIWVFEEAVDLAQVRTGALSDKALFYVPCGEEPMAARACRATLDLSGDDAAKCRIVLPYDLSTSSRDAVAALRSGSPGAGAKRHWEPFFQNGAQFSTGDARLDNLYRTSLLNIFLLRTKYPGAANKGEDLYLVKPGASIYDAFWYRDAAYMIAALDVAGQSEEAEKSLRLFWQSSLPGNFGSYEQQESGLWQSPLDQSDGQGQVLWALVHHAQCSGNLEWLRTVYPNIRKGADWIRNVTGQMRYLTENGDRPIYYGLLPAAEGEAIGQGYVYYHDFWAVLGLRMAIEAAKAVNEEKDVTWMTDAYKTFCASLSASVKLAFERVGGKKYIPATPFHPVSQLDIWGSIAALYPTRFLGANDSMISQTLDMMLQHCQEDEYTYFNRKKLWTYITVDWAMCYLLRDDLETFYRLFDGYVAHASQTNGWTEEIFLDTRQGTGDMPHGWAAAQFVLLLRNSLVYEDNDVLHLCWGAREDWLNNGITVRRAPTKFGAVDFDLRKSGDSLVLDYRVNPGAHQKPYTQAQLHLPLSVKKPASIRINGQVRTLTAGQRAIHLE
jgi:hypothetical protein